MRVLQKGDIVQIRTEGGSEEWCPGVVEIASAVSPDGIHSVGVRLYGMVRGGEGIIGGALPLMIDYNTGTIEWLMGGPYEMEVQAEGPTGEPLNV